MWQSPSLWGPAAQDQITLSLSLQLFVVLIFTRVIVLQNRTQHPGGDRWPEQAGGCRQVGGSRVSLAHCSGLHSPLPLPDPSSVLTQEHWGGVWVEPRKDCLSVRLLLCHPLSGWVGRWRAESITSLQREEMTTRNGSGRPSILSLLYNKTRTHVLSHVSARDVWSHNVSLQSETLWLLKCG